MTTGTPHDSGDDAANGDDDSDQIRDEDPSAASADAGPAAAADSDPNREATPDSEGTSERDDLAAKLERKRPPQPPQEELDELQQPATELRPATAQESGADSAAEQAVPAPTTGQADRARADDGEQDPEMAGLDELQPVATELRPATAQAPDAQSTAPVNAETADTDRDRDRDRDRDSDVEPADEEDEV